MLILQSVQDSTPGYPVYLLISVFLRLFTGKHPLANLDIFVLYFLEISHHQVREIAPLSFPWPD
jgi:hypothetical protein